jgi:hypothetical protein
MRDRVTTAAMHAFPRRFRATRGVEMRDTLSDVLDADHRRLAVVAAVVDLVLAGWALRWRTRPPLGRYLRFRLFERPLPVQDHPWLFDHVQGWFRYRQAALPVAIIFGIQMVFYMFVFDNHAESSPFDPVEALIIYAAAAMIVANVPWFARRDRDRIMRRHGFVPVERPGA